MTPRRVVALLLLLTIGVSSAEVLIADEAGVSNDIASALHAVLDHSGADDDGDPADDDCPCLCACGCVNAQVVVTVEPIEFRTSGVELFVVADAPLLVAKRARVRPHLRPPLA